MPQRSRVFSFAAKTAAAAAAGALLFGAVLLSMPPGHLGPSGGGGGARQELAARGLAPQRARSGGRSLQMLTHESSDGPMKMTFYMYRAQSKHDYPLENVNAADLPGVMWYLHNEVVGATPRKFFIERILRYKITMRSTDKLHEQRRAQFGPFVAFDSARCTVPNCDNIWNRFGFNIGCQFLNTSLNAYLSPFVTRLGVPGRLGNGALWYSLPGACPAMNFEAKTADCRVSMPGGQCNNVNLLGKPGVKCTYFVESAGEIRLDDLSGITDYRHWWSVLRNKEYNFHTDVGTGTDFWNYRHDPKRCAERMDKVQRLFKEKYPALPMTYGEPPCDAP